MTGRRESIDNLEPTASFCRRVVETAGWPTICLDPEFRILMWNRAAENIFGRKHEDSEGKNFLGLFIPPESRDRFSAVIESILAGESGKRLVCPIVASDGSWKTVLWALSPLSAGHDTPRAVILIGQNTTGSEQPRADQRLAVELLQLINNETTPCDLVQSITPRIREWFGCQAAGIRLHQGENSQNRGSRGSPGDFLQADIQQPERDSHSQSGLETNSDPACGNNVSRQFGPFGLSCGPKRSVWSTDSAGLLATTAAHDCRGYGSNTGDNGNLQSVALIPLRTDEETYGLMELSSTQRDHFTPEMISRLEWLATQVAVAVSRGATLKTSRSKGDERRQLIDTHSVGFIIHDAGGVILDVNDSMCRMSGYNRQEMIGHPTEQFLDRPYRDIVAGQLRLRRRGQTDPLELKLIHRDGHNSPVFLSLHTREDSTGRLQGAYSVITDIAARKPSRGGRRNQGGLMRAIINSLANPLYVIDVSDHTIIMTNSAAGFRPTLEKTTCYEYLHGLDQPCSGVGCSCPLKHVQATGRDVVFEHVHRDSDGTSRAVEVRCHPVLDGEGNVVQLIEHWIDISELKNTEQALYEKSAALREILCQIEAARKEVQENIKHNIEKTVTPALQRLRPRLDVHDQQLLAQLESDLYDLLSPFVGNLQTMSVNLSSRELEICNMVRRGMTSKDIAANLSLSVETVHKFRHLIRKKLGITGEDVNLCNYLRALANTPIENANEDRC